MLHRLQSKCHNRLTHGGPRQLLETTARHGLIGSMALVLITAMGAEAMAGNHLLGANIWASGYSAHPAVTEVRRAGYLTMATRARVLSAGLPLDRALAVISAMTARQARKFKVSAGISRALRARHSIGPSGALLGKAIPAAQLTPREALLLGWARAREARGGRKAMAVRAANIGGAGALQLLTQAAAALPTSQAPQLALALARASVSSRRGRRACAAYSDVQKAARNGLKSSVRLPIAERAVAAVRGLGKACSSGAMRPFRAAIQLPPPAAEPRPAAARPGRPSRASSSNSRAPAQAGRGIAFAVIAPVFKGYLQIPLVRKLAGRTRLDEVMLWRLMKKDPTGDLAVATLNAAVLMRRITPDDLFDVTWQAVLRLRGLLDAPAAQLKKLQVSALTGPQAMAIAYARALQGRGQTVAPPGAGVTALNASPHQLFVHGRQRVAANAALGPIMFLAHKVDMTRLRSPCAAATKAEATGFVIGKSKLPSAAKKALQAAMSTVKQGCSGGKKQR